METDLTGKGREYFSEALSAPQLIDRVRMSPVTLFALFAEATYFHVFGASCTMRAVQTSEGDEVEIFFAVTSFQGIAHVKIRTLEKHKVRHPSFA